VADLNEIVRTRVRSLGGNCLIGYHVCLHGFEHIPEESKVYLIMSAIGDAVLLEEKKQLPNGNSSTSEENSDKKRGDPTQIEEESKQQQK